jgi:hypothetical protein
VDLQHRLKSYYLTAIASIVIAVVGFTYNSWRLEVSEDNNLIRAAAFQVLIELSEFEQIIYAAHYDQDKLMGNPRNGWVKLGLVVDLSVLVSEDVERQALALKTLWAEQWQQLPGSRKTADALVEKIERLRDEIKLLLSELD